MTERYETAKQRAAGILYVRNRVAGELDALRAVAARLHEEACRAVRRGDERAARAFLAQKEERLARVACVEADLDVLRADAETAKAGLAAAFEATRAHERARLRARATELVIAGEVEAETS